MPPRSYPDTPVGHWRRHLAWSQDEAWKALGMSRSNYIPMEHGRTTLDRRTELALLRLAQAPEEISSLNDFLRRAGPETGLWFLRRQMER
jgi:DNA-binding XRE family transcriptional regulator